MKIGVFDHLDRNGAPLSQYYEERLRIIEAYDDAGFYAYHVAEHHFTPLGMAPSPNVFLAAVAQRTKRLRFGPLVYALPLHNPVRLVEEICMLDQMSGGRLDIGFGRGSSEIEIQLYGQDPVQAQEMYEEGLELVLMGLSRAEWTFSGTYFNVSGAPREIEPLQQPHPPIWYGAHTLASVDRAVRRGLNIICNDPTDTASQLCHRFRESWTSDPSRGPMPIVGFTRFVVVGDSDDDALRIARRCYRSWHDSFYHLFRKYGASGPTRKRASEIDSLIEDGRAIVGSTERVADVLQDQLRRTGADYFVGQFAFGDISLDEVLRSVDLFSRRVNPSL